MRDTLRSTPAERTTRSVPGSVVESRAGTTVGEVPHVGFRAMEANVEGPTPRGVGYPNLRGVLLALAVVGGGVLVAYAKRPCSGFAGSTSAWSDSLASAAALGLWALIVSTVLVFVRRRRKADDSRRRAILSGQTIAVTCILAFGGIVGGAESRSGKCSFTASVKATSPALKQQQNQFVAWYSAWAACLTPHGIPLSHEEKQLIAAVKGTSANAAETAAAAALSAYTNSAACMKRLPSGNHDIATFDRRLVASSSLEVRAYQLYRRGVNELIAGKGTRTFMLGDAPEEQAGRINRTMASEAQALYQRLGGAAAIGSRLPLQALLNAKKHE